MKSRACSEMDEKELSSNDQSPAFTFFSVSSSVSPPNGERPDRLKYQRSEMNRTEELKIKDQQLTARMRAHRRSTCQ